jgi:hypothetical protein
MRNRGLCGGIITVNQKEEALKLETNLGLISKLCKLLLCSKIEYLQIRSKVTQNYVKKNKTVDSPANTCHAHCT